MITIYDFMLFLPPCFFLFLFPVAKRKVTVKCHQGIAALFDDLHGEEELSNR